ncbi:MAG: hypothetical protein QM479_11050 [Pseudomonadota bacterium]
MNNNNCNDLFINNIVFSFNRPAQLDLFIRSYVKNYFAYPKLKIIYKYSNSLAQQGYRMIKKKHPQHQYICENDSLANFKNLTIAAINPETILTTFFVDDIVFINPFQGKNSTTVKLLIERGDICCASLRLHPGINYSYMASRPISPPGLDKNFIWNIPKKCSYWSYPMSVDGHIFKTADILKVLYKINFNTPTRLEYQLSVNPLKYNKMICFDKAIIINIPANKVQSTYAANRSQDVSIDLLNENFISGQQIDLRPLQGIQTTSCHQEIAYKFEQQTTALQIKNKNKNYKEIIIIADTKTIIELNSQEALLGDPGYLLSASLQLLPRQIKKSYYNYDKLSANQLAQFKPANTLIIIHIEPIESSNILIHLIKELENQGHQVYNARLNNISKKNLDQLAIQLGLEPLELKKHSKNQKILLKSNLNYNNNKSSLFEVTNKEDVPAELWDDKSKFISKYIKSDIRGIANLACIEKIYFLGNEHILFTNIIANKPQNKEPKSISYCSRPNEKFENDIKLMQQMNIPHATHCPSLNNEVQLRMLSYVKKIQQVNSIFIGSIKFIQDKDTGQLYLIDLDPTPSIKDMNPFFLQIFAKELLNFLEK